MSIESLNPKEERVQESLLVGTKEVLQILQIGRTKLHELEKTRLRSRFPQAVDRLGRTKKWRRLDIERWLNQGTATRTH